MKRIRCGGEEARAAIAALVSGGAGALAEAEVKVRPIVEAVRAEGDAALLRFTREFDGADLDPSRLEVTPEEMEAALGRLSTEVREALSLAAKRIREFHEAQSPEPVVTRPELGERLLLRPIPLRRVGLYVPGGRAAYPSTVLMNALPARAAGVGEVVLCTPPGRDGSVADGVLAAARLAGVDRVFRVGGAQAVAAMAFGTASVPKVDKIAGPGNVYVAAAKRLVRGEVEVDKDAGPSEVVVLLDEPRWAAWAAADLLAQAEHDPEAMAVGVAVGRAAADALAAEVEARLPAEPRREVIAQALERRGAIVEAHTREEALDVAESLAPEHLEIFFNEAEEWAQKVKCAGAVFCGPWSPVPFGDYIAGTNHVLPTGGSARWASPLGVLDFVKWSSYVVLGPEAAARLAEPAARLAELEGLPAHARALRLRLNPPGTGTGDGR